MNRGKILYDDIVQGKTTASWSKDDYKCFVEYYKALNFKEFETFEKNYKKLKKTGNKVFASGQAIREASLTVLRPTVHGSETSRTQKPSLCGLAASSGVLNPRENKTHRKLLW